MDSGDRLHYAVHRKPDIFGRTCCLHLQGIRINLAINPQKQVAS
jgi:hypothetical protein